MAVPLPRQAGAAALETLIIALPLLLTGLATLEVARWWSTRQIVSLAMTEAARAGTTTGGDIAAMRDAMARGLLPLFARDVSATGLAQGAQRRDAIAARRATQGLAAWEITVAGPRASHFDDFGIATRTERVLPDAYQAERHRALQLAGHPDGRGRRSGDTIFTANTLVLRATYLHTPLVPGMEAMLRSLGRHAGNDLAGAGMRGAGLLPMTFRIALPMQTPARESVVGAVIRPVAARGVGVDGVGGVPTQRPDDTRPGAPCIGIWCASPAASAEPAAQPPASSPPTAGTAHGADATSPSPPAEPSSWPPQAAGEPPAVAPARPGADDGCGVVLCCTPAS